MNGSTSIAWQFMTTQYLVAVVNTTTTQAEAFRVYSVMLTENSLHFIDSSISP